MCVCVCGCILRGLIVFCEVWWCVHVSFQCVCAIVLLGGWRSCVSLEGGVCMFH